MLRGPWVQVGAPEWALLLMQWVQALLLLLLLCLCQGWTQEGRAQARVGWRICSEARVQAGRGRQACRHVQRLLWALARAWALPVAVQQVLVLVLQHGQHLVRRAERASQRLSGGQEPEPERC
jgi:hypothetical protein